MKSALLGFPQKKLAAMERSVSDIYLYEDVPVLKNKLDIRDGKRLI